MTNKLMNWKSTLVILFLACSAFGAGQLDIPGPSGSVEFGGNVYALANGNFVVTDTEFAGDTIRTRSFGGSQVGAVYLINGADGSIISRLTGSNPGNEVGDTVRVLPNGNYVVGSRNWDNGGTQDVGAVTFCNGWTGCDGVVSTSNSLVGSTANDRVGDVIDVLLNGNYIVRTVNWDNGAQFDAGAATFCSGVSGCIGAVSASNSLVGTTSQDHVGEFNAGLSNNDYVVMSASWHNAPGTPVGAVTRCSGTVGCTGPVSASNSLVGSQLGDNVGSVRPLSNAAYAVVSLNWDNGGVSNAGAVTICTGPAGCVGAVNSTNSLVGTVTDDVVGAGGVFELANGNIVINNRNTDIDGVNAAGAVTFCDNLSACTGPATASNSLHGTSALDSVGLSGILVLPNGNYVVLSQAWQFGAASDGGAATFCDGSTGCTGPVTSTNSLFGNQPSSAVGTNKSFVLPNGNYVIVSDVWEDGSGSNQLGAVTFCNGSSGCTGVVSDSNSLVGSASGDRIGANQNKVLANGNFVIRSVDWGLNDLGAVTFCSGTTGCPTGPISAGNSLVGTTVQERIGSSGILPLNNGNYVVLSPGWDRPNGASVPGGVTTNAGAATYCSGTTGCTGNPTESNSLVGSNTNDQVGFQGRVLTENYIVSAENFDYEGVPDVGAVTWCDEDIGCAGDVSPANSILGDSSGDRIGSDGFRDFPNGDYLFISPSYAPPAGAIPGEKDKRAASLGGGSTRNGAITVGDGQNGTFGTINSDNSVIGIDPAGGFGLEHVFNERGNQLIISRTADNIATLYRRVTTPAPYDFDGDGRSDASTFRPSQGWWHLNGSTSGYFVLDFGQDGDVLAAADYDGDGKTDTAVWRPGPPNEAKFYILNSSDFSVTEKLFGQTGDDPVVVGDWDGDGKADPAVYRDSAMGSQSIFYYLGSNANPGNNITYVPFGTAGDKPVKGDFDGDGNADAAIFRPSTMEWWIRGSSDPENASTTIFGLEGDSLVPGDYDGDGKTDIAVFRAPTWFVLNSLNGSLSRRTWGLGSDVLVPGDYDGDGRIDPSVFRPSSSTWYLRQSSDSQTGYIYFGLPADNPVPNSSVTD